MTWEYISGFFDADGSITFVRERKNQMKTPQLSFSNNEKDILIEIQDFIYKELKIKGFISTKRKVNKNHKVNYDLKYSYLPKILALTEHIISYHPKKSFRINLIRTKLLTVIPRNGKYNEYSLELYNQFEKLFFSTFQ